MMRRVPALGAWLLLAGVSAAQAHAHLQAASPADQSVLSAAPTQLVLHFTEAARLTALAIGKAGESSHKLPLPAGDPAAQIVVPLPPLAPGQYVVSWRAVGADGHVVPGQIQFTLQ
jgi:methionine-rich copper-binding protein CopC